MGRKETDWLERRIVQPNADLEISLNFPRMGSTVLRFYDRRDFVSTKTGILENLMNNIVL